LILYIDSSRALKSSPIVLNPSLDAAGARTIVIMWAKLNEVMVRTATVSAIECSSPTVTQDLAGSHTSRASIVTSFRPLATHFCHFERREESVKTFYKLTRRRDSSLRAE
jgi:hypothetical protein